MNMAIWGSLAAIIVLIVVYRKTILGSIAETLMFVREITRPR